MTFIIFRNYCCRIITKNLTKCNILKTFALKNNGKFADHNLEKLWPRSLALAYRAPRPFLSLASRGSVLEKSVLGLGLGFFSSSWPWSQRSCPRLHLWYTYFKKIAPYKVKPFKRLIFGDSSWRSPGVWYSQLSQNICLLNVYWYRQKKNWKSDFGGSIWGNPHRVVPQTMSKY